MDSTSKAAGRNLRVVFVVVLALAVTALFLAVIWPFLKPLLLGAMLVSLCRPLYNWMVRLVRGRRSLASALTLLLLFIVVVGPISGFLGLVVNQALKVSDEAIPWVRQHLGSASTFDAHDWLAQRFPSAADYVPTQSRILESVGNAARSAGGFLVAGLSRFTAGTAAFLLDLFVMLYAMFYFFRDGEKILARLFFYLPLRDADEARLLDGFTSVTRATVKGTIVIGMIQGGLAGLAFWVAGIDGAAFWGTLMAILSVVPGIGATLIWAPAVIYLFITGQTLTGLLLGGWCAAVVGTVDNILRPTLVGNDAKMPDLLILVGTLGGLFLFGPIGFIVGPVICGLFLTVWEIYGATLKNLLPPVKTAHLTGDPGHPAPKGDSAPEDFATAPAKQDSAPNSLLP